MRVAIVHDWLTGMRGGEKVLEILCEMFPQAEIFTLFYNKGKLTPIIENRKIHVSFLQNFPFARNKYRNYLPFFPAAIERFNLRGFDLVLSSSHCVAKGARPQKNAYHICYCYTPMRYVWFFFDAYFGHCSPIKKSMLSIISNYLKRWDLATTSRVTDFVAISETVRTRIQNIYKRDAHVIYPPVDVGKFNLAPQKPREDFYLCVSALVPYKRIDVLVEAFNVMKDKKLYIVGEGNSRAELEKIAKGANITFLGRQSDGVLCDLYQRARGFIYTAEEDFGIAPLEAQATGLPVIGFSKGGLLETVIPLRGANRTQPPTGIFFHAQETHALIGAVEEFEKRKGEFVPEALRANSLRFSESQFRRSMNEFIQRSLKHA